LKFLQTYRQKNIALLIGFVLSIIAIYPITISNTVKLGKNIHQLELQEQQAVHAPLAIANYNQNIKQLDEQISSYVSDTLEGEQYLLELVSNFSQQNNLTLTAFHQPTATQKEKITIYTREVALEGEYIPLLRLLHYLEYTKKIGRMASVEFETYIQKRSRRKKLQMSLFIQNCTIQTVN